MASQKQPDIPVAVDIVSTEEPHIKMVVGDSDQAGSEKIEPSIILDLPQIARNRAVLNRLLSGGYTPDELAKMRIPFTSTTLPETSAPDTSISPTTNVERGLIATDLGEFYSALKILKDSLPLAKAAKAIQFMADFNGNIVVTRNLNAALREFDTLLLQKRTDASQQIVFNSEENEAVSGLFRSILNIPAEMRNRDYRHIAHHTKNFIPFEEPNNIDITFQNLLTHNPEISKMLTDMLVEQLRIPDPKQFFSAINVIRDTLPFINSTDVMYRMLNNLQNTDLKPNVILMKNLDTAMLAYMTNFTRRQGSSDTPFSPTLDEHLSIELLLERLRSLGTSQYFDNLKGDLITKLDAVSQQYSK